MQKQPQHLTRVNFNIQMLTVSSHILHESFQSEDAIDKLQESYITAVPYNHVVISSLCSEDVMKAVQKEVCDNMLILYREGITNMDYSKGKRES